MGERKRVQAQGPRWLFPLWKFLSTKVRVISRKFGERSLSPE